MKGGRVVEHHQSVGREVQQGAIVLTVQIHDRTLQFKSPALGKLNSIAPLGGLPEPGDLLFRLLVEDKPETKREADSRSKSTNAKEAFNTAFANTSDSIAEKATKSHQGTSPVTVSGSPLSKVIASVRMLLGALMWLVFGSALAGVYVLATDGESPIGGWVPENRITFFDDAIDQVSELHIDWIKSRQLARYEKDDRWAEVRKARAEESSSDAQDGVSNPETPVLNTTQTRPQQSAGQLYQENVRPCSVRDESCDPDVHVLCQLRVGSYSGEERWRNPIQSYMCAPQRVSYSNGMWRQGYADGTEACRKYFGENSFLKSSFSRNSGFISSAQHKSDAPAEACLTACRSEAGKFKKQCTGLPQKS